MPKGCCDPVESPHWSTLLAGPVDLWRGAHAGVVFFWQELWPSGGPLLQKPDPEGLHLVEITLAGAVHVELQPMGRTYFGEICGGLSPVGETRCRNWGRE